MSEGRDEFGAAQPISRKALSAGAKAQRLARVLVFHGVCRDLRVRSYDRPERGR